MSAELKKPLTVLIVEDDEDYAFLIKDYLREKFTAPGLNLHHATSFKTALEKIDSNGGFDLYIFDYLLNHINGIELITAVRSKGIDSPIIFLTGYGNEEVAVSALKAGATDYLSKAKLTPELLQRSFHHAIEMVEFKREKKRYDEELRLKNEQLEALTRHLENRVAEEVRKNQDKEHMVMMQSRMAAMGEMLGYITHQWRQPLSSLALIVQNLQELCAMDSCDKDSFRDYTDSLLEIIGHLSATIDDFKGFFSPNRHKRHSLLSDIVSKTIKLVTGSLKDRFIVLKSEIRADSEVLCQPNELCHALLNIINNARDALIERDIKDPVVTITVDRHNDKAMVSIRDNARGIDANLIGSIFDPYVTTKKDGSGIGLYMSKLIVERNLGGTIYAKNTLEGAEFVILI